MKPKHVYLFLCIVGLVVPYIAFAPFVHMHGANVKLIMEQLFATPISSSFGLDVFVSILVLWTAVAIEGRRVRMRWWWAPILGSIVGGVALGLPLFLYIRERSLEERHAAPTPQ
jgi:hypothetical protein